jgi:hypothetical protein
METQVSVTYTWKRNTINCLFNNAPGNLLKFASVEQFSDWFARNEQFVNIHQVTQL